MTYWKIHRRAEEEPEHKDGLNSFFFILFIIVIILLLFFAFHKYSFKKIGVKDDNLIQENLNDAEKINDAKKLYGDVNQIYEDE